jgi:hypothetical protein
MSVLAALNAEIEELEAAMNADPRIVRLHELKRLRDAYAAMPSISGPPAPIVAESKLVSAGKPVEEARRARGRKRSPEREQALQETKSFLNGKTAPTKTSDVLNHLEKRKIVIGGNDPQSNLSALLYHSKEFKSHGKMGWTLKRIGPVRS